jgi:hypothetical protein
MAWGALNVGERRARLVARPATGALLAPSQRHFLIANLELKFNVSYIRINDVKFSNRKFFAIFHYIFPSLKPPTSRSVVLKASGQDARPEGSRLRPHSIPSPSAQVKPLIETPRLEIRVTSRKQNQSQFLIETNQALCAAGSSLHGPPAAPASPQARPRSATTFRPFPPLC